MTTRLVAYRALTSFARWYWNQVLRAPRDFVLFAGGGIYVAVLIQSPKLLGLVERMM
jgi:hypothetical protein